MSSNSVCNHYTHDKQITLLDLVYHSYDYKPNWTALSPITIINYSTEYQIILVTLSYILLKVKTPLWKIHSY